MLPHAPEAPARTLSGLTQVVTLLPGAPDQGHLSLAIGEGTQEPEFDWKGHCVEYRAASIPVRVQHY